MIVQLILQAALVFIVSSFGVPERWTDYNLEQVHSLNESSGNVVDFVVRAKRFNKTTYVIAGDVTLNGGNALEHDIEIQIFYSAQGNNQYTLQPYRIPRKPICVFLNTDYRKYCMNELHVEAVGWPYSENESDDLCPLFTPGTYEVKNFLFNKQIIPGQLDPGMYRAVLLIYKGEVTVSGLELYLKLS